MSHVQDELDKLMRNVRWRVVRVYATYDNYDDDDDDDDQGEDNGGGGEEYVESK